MRVRLVLSALLGAAVVVPALSADAACVSTPPRTDIQANVCTEGLRAVPGGWSTASSVSVYINGGRTGWCVARITVTTTGVDRDPRTFYAC